VTVLKFGTENQVNLHNYLSILFYAFPLIARSGKCNSQRWAHIRTGSDRNFFENWWIRTRSDSENFCCFNV